MYKRQILPESKKKAIFEVLNLLLYMENYDSMNDISVETALQDLRYLLSLIHIYYRVVFQLKRIFRHYHKKMAEKTGESGTI